VISTDWISRLESVSKELGEPVLCSSDFVNQLDSAEAFRDLGDQALKGKSHSVRVFGWGERSSSTPAIASPGI
jgi:class 3 adenylate cyclase